MKGFELFVQRVLFVLLEIEHQGDALVPLPDARGAVARSSKRPLAGAGSANYLCIYVVFQ